MSAGLVPFEASVPGLQMAGSLHCLFLICVNPVVCPNFLSYHSDWIRTHLNGLIRRRLWQPTPVLLPGKSHGWRSLVGCSPWGCYESDMTERLHFHFSLSCIGEGNGNPLQCSCLENPRDGGAWWAAVYGVTQSWTRLKRLSSSSSNAKCKQEHILKYES